MNVKEGMRRLALLLGILGAALGCFASYIFLNDTVEARARYKAFEVLANSEAVQQERKILQTQPDFIPDTAASAQKILPLPKGATSSPTKTYLDDSGNPITSAVTDEPHGWQVVDANEKPEPSQVKRGNIKAVHWTKDLAVESIETEDGNTLYAEPKPTLWPYLLAAIFPVLGFVIPWGSIRALAWVGFGFVEGSK